MAIESRIIQGTKVFSDWEVNQYIGSGSGGKTAVFSIVRKHEGWEEHSALKVVNVLQEIGKKEELEEKYRQEYDAEREELCRQAQEELRLMSYVRGNANIVEYYDFIFVDYQEENMFGTDLLIRMELLENLHQERKNKRVYTEQEIIRIGKDICKGLQICHKAGIIHRDIKPANIFITSWGDYKLGDFGIARMVDAGQKASTKMGTRAYAAPEQFMSSEDKYDSSVDTYSLGLTLYELANDNKLPFANSGYVRESEIQLRIMGKQFPPAENASPDFTKVINKACEYKAENRFKSAQEFEEALANVEKGLVTIEETVKKEEDGEKIESNKKRKKWVLPLVGVLCIILIILCAQGISTITDRNDNRSGNNGEVVSANNDKGNESAELKKTDKVSADFNEEFDIKANEELYIGNNDVKIKLEYIRYEEEYALTSIGYTLTVGDTVYKGNGSWVETLGGSVFQDVFSNNRVKVIKANKDESVTLLITENTIIKEPVVLSGDENDEFISDEYEYVLGDKFILYLDKNVKVYGNTVEVLNSLIDLVEKETGLKLENNSAYGDLRDDMLVKTFGQDAFAGVDHNNEKYQIIVDSSDKNGTTCTTYGMTIMMKDIDFKNGINCKVLHELVHSLHYANGVKMGAVMDEGYASYFEWKIPQSGDVNELEFGVNYGYLGYDKQITKDNAEELFVSESDNGDQWNACLYGYRFVTFLNEEYGNDILDKILAEANKNAGMYSTVISAQDMVPVIKSITADNVFEKFAEWLEVNEDKL